MLSSRMHGELKAPVAARIIVRRCVEGFGKHGMSIPFRICTSDKVKHDFLQRVLLEGGEVGLVRHRRVQMAKQNPLLYSRLVIV